MRSFRCVILVILIFSARFLSAQTTYPKITGYTSLVHPVITFSKDETGKNFKDYYIVGLPTGINIWKTAGLAFSCEFVPYIKAEHGSSKMNNFLFHPGVLVPLGHGFIFVERLAFETSGRYGFTTVINKTIIKAKNCSYFVALPFPVRFGNDLPTTFTVAFQFGIAF